MGGYGGAMGSLMGGNASSNSCAATAPAFTAVPFLLLLASRFAMASTMHFLTMAATRDAASMYPQSVLRPLTPGKSPTLGLFVGLIITLAAVVAYSVYITFQ